MKDQHHFASLSALEPTILIFRSQVLFKMHEIFLTETATLVLNTNAFILFLPFHCNANFALC